MQHLLITAKQKFAQIYTPDRAAALIIAIGLLIRIPLIISTSESWRPEDTASIAHFFTINGHQILYPQIYWGGNGPGYVESEFQLYPYIVSLLYSLFGEHIWLGRLVSFLITAITTVTFYLLARKILNQNQTLWALILFTWSLIFLRYSTAFMPEATVMCFYMGGLYFFFKWQDDRRFRFLLLAGICTALAILVKPPAIHIGLLFALLAIYRFGFWSIIKDWKIWFVIVLCLFPAAIYYAHAHDLFVEFGNSFGVSLGGDSKFGNARYWLSPGFYSGVAQIEYQWVFGPLGLVAFGVGLYQTIKRRSYFLLFAFITIILYYFIIARYSGYSRGIQYHIFMVPYAAIGFGIGVETLINSRFRVPGRILAAISILGVILWSARFYPGLFRPGYVEQFVTCGEYTRQIVPATSLIIVSNPYTSIDDQGIPNNYQEPMVFYYSQRSGWSLPSDWLTDAKFTELRNQGAKYYVILDRDLHLLSDKPGFSVYLYSNLNLLGSEPESTCRIYEFK